jgi:putative heme-binding domain-containing protein
MVHPMHDIPPAHRRQGVLSGGLLLSLLLSFTALGTATQAQDDDTPWRAVEIPAVWRSPPAADKGNDLGFSWYRCQLVIPESWKGERIELFTEAVDDAREVYLNGVKVISLGNMPPRFRSGLGSEMSFHIQPQHLLFGQPNVLAIRSYRNFGRTNFNVAAPVLAAEKQALQTRGRWQFRPGDSDQWSLWKKGDPTPFRFTALTDRETAIAGFRALENDRGPRAPAEAVTMLKTMEGLDIQLVLSDPDIGQPLSFKFDPRGRLWLVQYLQYPNPAGLTMVSRDKYLRAVYDKIPRPPPHHFPGKDRITIHEDTDGDGVYDSHKTFLDGLSLVTSFAIGRGGVWVLNPPYLLFYHDRNGDDVPDGDPEVHLEGFGMEDSHSITNSLRWGPDGWLYASQGSTVSGKVRPFGSKQDPVHSMGQLIWRYQPEERRYEIFAEGGGNSFGVEFDAHGRVYSGHNGGNTRGFHYVQGGYFQKGFAKHGALSNPYTFGYFPFMAHHQVPRFTHTFVINEAPGWPQLFQGSLMGVSPLASHVVASQMEPHGSTFRTRDIGHPITSSDNWFRPVDIQMGPDGAVYVADMYEQRIDHAAHYQGRVHTASGRIYRLHAGHKPLQLDLAALPTPRLVEVLSSENKWHRQTALRLLADRRDADAIAPLEQLLATRTGLPALNALWALYLSDGLDGNRAIKLLGHADPHVRAWTVRLICDDNRVSSRQARALIEMAVGESHVEVRSQLACSARRLPAETALDIARQLLCHSEDADDPHLPLLLWWVLEEKAESHQLILAIFQESDFWLEPLVQQHILERLIRRYALSGTQSDLATAAGLLEAAPDDISREKLMDGFELAYVGRSLAGLSPRLLEAIDAGGGGSLKLQLRLKSPRAIEAALAQVQDTKLNTGQRRDLLEVFGQIDTPQAVPVLLQLAAGDPQASVRSTALASLQSYPQEQIGQRVITFYSTLPSDARPAADSLLASRASWTRLWLSSIEKTPALKETIPLSSVRRMLLHDDKQIAESINQIWGNVQGATTGQMKQRIERFSRLINTSTGNPYNGRQIFAKQCGKCHTLFDQGGEIGPNLTPYKRDDLGNMLLNIVNPSIEIRKGFENFVVFTDDGRTLNGFIEDEDNRVVILKGLDGQRIVVPRDSIDEMSAIRQSIMPEGILETLTEEQVRDLFAFLRASQPLP